MGIEQTDVSATKNKDFPAALLNTLCVFRPERKFVVPRRGLCRKQLRKREIASRAYAAYSLPQDQLEKNRKPGQVNKKEW